MINEYENTLRRLILSILGEDSSLYKVSSERISNWDDKKNIAQKKNNGILLENRLIYYSDFYDLKNIVSKNWKLFLPILQDKRRFEVYFEELEDYRNNIAHGRNLTQSQEYLLQGITTDLKTLITVYHNKNEMNEDYFIRVIRITDNLGNLWEKGKAESDLILRVGDYYELYIEAHDPKGRKITYNIFTGHGFEMKQESNRFSFTIENNLVGNPTAIYLTASTANSEYKNEDGLVIYCTVLPK